MATGNIVVSDYYEDLIATARHTEFNTSGYLMCLFTNNITPDPSTLIGTFVEAAYGTYARVNTNGVWSAPVQIVPGQYAMPSSALSYAAPGAGSVTIYGAFLTDSFFLNVIHSFLFASPVTLNAGDPNLLVIDNYNLYAAILI